MALTLNASDIMSRFSCPIDAKILVLECMSLLVDHVEAGEETHLLMAFDILAGVKMKVYE